MTTDAIDFCTRLGLAHASLTLKLDEELGTHHGLGLSDFVLLRLVAGAEGGRLAVADLVRPTGLRLSVVTRQLLPLEKTGLVQRETAAVGGRREVVIRASGRRVLGEAVATAEAVCADALRELPAASLRAADAVLSALARTPALAL